MGIAERKEREKEEVRHKILEAAHALFEAHGYENVTMRAVADAIEYSPTTIYHHFANKDALVEAVCFADYEKLTEAMQSQPLPANPVERIRAMGRAYAAFGLKNPNHYRFMFMTPGDWKRHVNADELPPGMAYGFLRSAAGDAIEQGYFQRMDVDLASQILWASIHGVVSLLLTYTAEQFPHVPPHPELLDEAMDAALRGLMAPRGER